MNTHDSAPFMRFRDIPLALLLLPFAILLGLHVAGIAMIIRRWTRIPYLLAMIALYGLLLVPFWLPGPTFHFLPACVGSIILMVCLVVPIAIRGREEVLEGTNFEASAAAHIVLVLLYVLLPAIHAATQAAEAKGRGKGDIPLIEGHVGEIRDIHPPIGEKVAHSASTCSAGSSPALGCWSQARSLQIRWRPPRIRSLAISLCTTERMSQLPEETLHEGVVVDIAFAPPGPSFGDVFQICGFENPNFPPSGNYAFGSLNDLQFSQVDDYFGVESLSDDGDDIAVWLYPLVDGEPVHHHPGPFEGLRVQFNVLRNPPTSVDHFLKCVSSIAAISGSPAPDLERLRSMVSEITDQWASQGIVVGTHAALEIDY